MHTVMCPYTNNQTLFQTVGLQTSEIDKSCNIWVTTLSDHTAVSNPTAKLFSYRSIK